MKEINIKAKRTFIYRWMIILSFTAIFFSCSKDLNSVLNEVIETENKRLNVVVPTTEIAAILEGLVVDELGSPISGAEVKAGNKTATTDAAGFFRLMNVGLNGSYAVIKAKKSGYFEGIRTHTPTEGAFNKIIIGLLGKGTAKTISAEIGGKLTFEDGKVELNFSANALINLSGKPYKGTANISARYINPEAENFGEVMPGALVGLTDAETLTGLISYGMISVEMTDNVGNKLEIAPNSSVEVTMPAILDVPLEMPVWHFNETYGIWVEAGKAEKLTDKYVFDANYFSSWNLDIPYNGVNVTLQIENQTGMILPNQYVQVFDNSDNHLGSTYTDNKGQIKIIRGPSSMKLKIKTDCAETFERSVTVTKPIEIVKVNTSELFTISGKITDCENVPVVEKYYIIEKLGDKNFVFKGKTGENGIYQSTAMLCNLNPESMHEMVASVFVNDNIIKKDTVKVIFWGNTIPLNINICGLKELTLPTLTTASVSEVKSNTAISGGVVLDDGGSEITARGVCWSKNPNPTIADSKTNDGTGLGSFISNLTGLIDKTTYYVRSYATNSAGTAYGNERSFKTLEQSYLNPDLTYGSVTDIDGNTYATIQIGTQVWMAENLKTTRYNDGSNIPNVLENNQWLVLTTGAWCYFDNNVESNTIYGKLYNWYAVNTGKLCPTGWHIPTDAEWTVLSNYLGGASVAGGKMKSTTGWKAPNTGATNSSGFSGLPGGDRLNNGTFNLIGSYGNWWSSTEVVTANAWYRNLSYNISFLYSYNYYKKNGYSCRCVRD